jgi:hypothetical protein
MAARRPLPARPSCTRTRASRRCTATRASHASPRRGAARLRRGGCVGATPLPCAASLNPCAGCGAPAAQAKAGVEIDKRFAGVFNDPKFKRKTVVDKRGRLTEPRRGAVRRLRSPSWRPPDFARRCAASAPRTCAASTACPARTRLRRSRRALRVRCGAGCLLRAHAQCPSPRAAQEEEGAAASSSDDEEEPEAAGLTRGATRARGIRGSVSASSSSSDEGAAARAMRRCGTHPDMPRLPLHAAWRCCAARRRGGGGGERRGGRAGTVCDWRGGHHAHRGDAPPRGGGPGVGPHARRGRAGGARGTVAPAPATWLALLR